MSDLRQALADVISYAITDYAGGDVLDVYYHADRAMAAVRKAGYRRVANVPAPFELLMYWFDADGELHSEPMTPKGTVQNRCSTCAHQAGEAGCRVGAVAELPETMVPPCRL